VRRRCFGSRLPAGGGACSSVSTGVLPRHTTCRRAVSKSAVPHTGRTEARMPFPPPASDAATISLLSQDHGAARHRPRRWGRLQPGDSSRRRPV